MLPSSIEQKVKDSATYVDELLSHYRSNKNIVEKFFILFDKKHNPYWAILRYDSTLNQYAFSIYTLKSTGGLHFHDGEIGVCRYRIKDKNIIINANTQKEKVCIMDALCIRAKAYKKMGLAAQMMEIMSYEAYSFGAKYIIGEVVELGSETERQLKDYYKKNGFLVTTPRMEIFSGRPKLLKQIKEKDVLNTNHKLSEYSLGNENSANFFILTPRELQLEQSQAADEYCK